MTESQVREKFKELEREARNGGEAPTLLHMAKGEGGGLVGAEIRSNKGVLWSWPQGFKSGISQSGIDSPPFSVYDMHSYEVNRWCFS